MHHSLVIYVIPTGKRSSNRHPVQRTFSSVQVLMIASKWTDDCNLIVSSGIGNCLVISGVVRCQKGMTRYNRMIGSAPNQLYFTNPLMIYTA